MDIVAIRTALRGLEPPATEPAVDVRSAAFYDAPPAPSGGSPLEDALLVFEHAVRRHAQAQSEAALSGRPSTLKASLKSAAALHAARADLLAQLQIEDVSRPMLKLCP